MNYIEFIKHILTLLLEPTTSSDGSLEIKSIGMGTHPEVSDDDYYFCSEGCFDEFTEENPRVVGKQ